VIKLRRLIQRSEVWTPDSDSDLCRDRIRFTACQIGLPDGDYSSALVDPGLCSNQPTQKKLASKNMRQHHLRSLSFSSWLRVSPHRAEFGPE
jgi:hypothetical protein